MKIVFLNIYQNSVDRGAETFVKELSKRLSRKHKVEVISSDNKITSQKRWPFLWRLFLDSDGVKIFFFTLKNIKKIWKEKYDVVIPVNGGWQAALVRIVTWLYGGKMVISGQSGMGWDDINNLWCFPDIFVALSEYASNWAKGMNSFVKIKVIPNGVDTKKFISKGEKFRINLKKPVILCVGALIKQKRIDLAIKAVSKLKNASLLVCGSGELKDEIDKLGKKILRERFKLISVPFEKISSLYRNADLFTLPSEDYQAFEIVLIEAMATNLAVVANDDPIREEIVGSAGLLVDPLDIKKYSLSLDKALKTNWLDKPLKQAKKFDWDIISQKYEELFKEFNDKK